MARACTGVARACRAWRVRVGAVVRACRGVVRAHRVWCDQEYGGGGLYIHQKRKKSAMYGRVRSQEFFRDQKRHEHVNVNVMSLIFAFQNSRLCANNVSQRTHEHSGET